MHAGRRIKRGADLGRGVVLAAYFRVAVTAGARDAVLDDVRMAAVRLRDHALVQGVDVVRTEQAEAGCVGKREVEQRFVALALDELGCGLPWTFSVLTFSALPCP